VSSKVTSQTESARPLILLVFLGLCWSLRLLAIKHTADSGAKAIDIALVATIAIVFLLLGINFARSKLPPITSAHLKFYGLAGIFGFGAPFLAETTVAAHLPALVFVMIIATTPILTLLIAIVMRIERPSLIRVLGTLIGFLAVAVVIFATQTNGRANVQPMQPLWIFAAFSIPMLYALYLLYIANRWPENLDNLQGALGQTTAGLIMYLGIWVFSTSRFGDIASLAMDWPIWAVIVSEVTALVVLFRIARMRGGSFVSQANYIAVVASAALSTMFFGQPFNWAVVIGIALLVVSMRLSMKKVESGL
jgi:drug/metabolite transporter (DMT)-like permease